MKHFIAALAVVFPVIIAADAHAQSLGDLAKKEKERRQHVQSDVKEINNGNAPQYTYGTATASKLPPSREAQGNGKESAARPGTAAKPASDEPVDFQGRPESWWKQTMGDARKKVKDLENEQNVLTLKLADLQNQFYREDDGFKQQEIQRQIQKTLYEQDLNKDNLSKAKNELADLEKEARKSGALPGWLTSTTP